MDSQNIANLQRATRNFPYLQGLAAVIPLGLMFLVMGLARLVWGMDATVFIFSGGLFLAAAVIALPVAIYGQHYYRDRFGVARPSFQSGTVVAFVLTVVGCFVVAGILSAVTYGSQGGTEIVGSKLHIPTIVLAIGVSLLVPSFINSRVTGATASRNHALALAGVALIYAGFMNLWWPPLDHIGSPVNAYTVLTGMAMILAGVLPMFPWRHYIIIGLALFASGTLPVFHLATVQWYWKGWDFVLQGIALVLAGVIDHMILTRSFRRAELRNENA